MGMNFNDPKKPENTTTTIMDSKNQAMVMLISSDGQKSSFAMKMDYNKMQEMVDEGAVQAWVKNSFLQFRIPYIDAEGEPLTRDQRGVERPQGPQPLCDVGSFELESLGL